MIDHGCGGAIALSAVTCRTQQRIRFSVAIRIEPPWPDGRLSTTLTKCHRASPTSWHRHDAWFFPLKSRYGNPPKPDLLPKIRVGKAVLFIAYYKRSPWTRSRFRLIREKYRWSGWPARIHMPGERPQQRAPASACRLAHIAYANRPFHATASR